jgi:hypothetical protein
MAEVEMILEPTDYELELVRKAIENELVLRRDARISVLRNNGCSIKEPNGEPSALIRMTHEEAFLLGLKTVSNHRSLGYSEAFEKSS